MSVNNKTITDEDGDYPDWIELFNAGNNAINLQSYYLSDDDSNYQKWQFGDTEIGAKEFLLLFASGKNRIGEITYWNTVIEWGDYWNYIVPTSQPAADWNALEFNDATWKTGRTGIGYGDDDDETIIDPAISLYARKYFNIDDINDVIGAVLNIDFDDAFVAYLNGVEIARENIGTSGIQPSFDQLANDDGFEAKIFEGGYPDKYIIDDALSILKEGENVLAVQVHNLELESSDLTFIPFFTLKQASSTNASAPPPLLQLPVSGIHSNFKIKSEGELIILSDSNGDIIDSVYTGFISTDVSRGRQPDGSDDWFYFGEPTPGSANVTTASDSIIVIDDLQFSEMGGFYNSQLSLTLTSDNENTSIYFTRDGSSPNQNSLMYNGSITISSTTVIKAISVHDSGQRSEVVTNTYFINENRPLPVISISTSPEDFELLYENFDAEVPIHIEMYEKSGDLAFSHNAGAEVFGSGSSGFEQKSLSIFFRGKYGVGTLKYKLFPELPFERYESFILRNGGNDWWSTLFRDALTSNGLMEGTAVDYQEYRPSVVYINGEYWGIHNIREKVNEHYIQDHHFISEDNLDMLEYKEVITPEIIHGDLEHHNSMIDFLNENNLSDPQNYEYIKSIIDIDNFIDYQIAEIYCANIDWPANNHKFWRAKSADGKWRRILYDTDTGYGLWDDWWAYGTPGWELDHVAHAINEGSYGNAEEGWPNPGWSTYIFRMLLNNDDFKNEFINRFADYLNTRFAPFNVLNKVSQFESGIKLAIPDHLARWDRSRNDYNEQVEKVETFAERRPDFVRSHLISNFNLTGTANITVKIEPAGSGVIKLNSLYIDKNSWHGIYFQGAPVNLTANPAPGYKFKEWFGAVSSSSSLSVNPQDGLTVTAVFERDSLSNSIVINEINYNSHNDFNPGDWIELYNNNFENIDLSNWKIFDNADTNVFIIPEGALLESGDYLVLCRNAEDFSEVFSSVDNFIGGLEFGLTSTGDAVRLFDSENNLVDSVAFSSIESWPIQPNGNGPTLELKNPNLDNSIASNWTSSLILGTPGEINSGYEIISNAHPGTKVDDYEYGRIQNYPNPFKYSTIFNYIVKNEGHVNITIYNILGEKIVTVIDKQHIPGEYTITWNGRNLNGHHVSNGVYIYVMKSNWEVIEIKKMIKLK